MATHMDEIMNSELRQRAEELADTGRTDTTPVPAIAMLLYLDQLLERPAAASLLVSPSFGYELLATTYITVPSGPLATMEYPASAKAVRRGEVPEFTIVIQDTPCVAAIVRGRILSVRLMSEAEQSQHIHIVTTDENGQPI